MKYLFNTLEYLLQLEERARAFLMLLALLALAGCAVTNTARLAEADNVAAANGFTKKIVKGGDFFLTTYQKVSNNRDPFVFYIESDGHAFTSYGVSDDPTPYHPNLLKLAVLDTRPNVIYVARPCQYTPMELNPRCRESAIFWTTKRLSEEVVVSTNSVINSINNGKSFSLVGYSGGGGIAVLVATRNNNVKDIITIAGNLDIVGFSDFHSGGTPSNPQNRQLADSLNPLDYATKVNNIPQLHLSGGMDRIVPPFIAANYTNASSSPCVHQKTYSNCTHSKGWDSLWNDILNIPLNCKP